MKNQTFMLFASIVICAFFVCTHSYAQLTCMSCDIPTANYVFNDQDIISNQTFNGDVIEINGTVYIDGSCTFTQCTLHLSEQARIELMPGATELFLHRNRFYDCCDEGYMWDGIYTTDQDNYIFARNNYFIHGENVLVEAFGAELILNSNEFDRCYYPLTLRDWVGSPRIEFRGNTIQSTQPIIAQPVPPNARTDAGVAVNDYVSTGPILTIGDASASASVNSFINVNAAIASQNSDIRIINNLVENSEFGFQHYNTSPNDIFRFIVGGTGTFERNTLVDVESHGVLVTGNVELSILNNLIDGGTTRGIMLHSANTNPVGADIRYNEMSLGKHNAGAAIIYFKGIEINSVIGSIDIVDNSIQTKSLNGIPLAIGEGIDVISCGGGGSRIDILQNTIENVLTGIRARLLYYETELTTATNRIEFTTPAAEFGDFGINTYWCTHIDGEIYSNYIENYITGIYGNYVYNTNVYNNELLISAYPYTTNSTVGIHWSIGQNIGFYGNEIRMTNGLNQNPISTFGNKGIFLESTVNSIISHNLIENAYYGLQFSDGNFPSWIHCNVFDYNGYGVLLMNATIGVNDGFYRNIGHINNPSDNEWHNELFPPLRLVGSYQSGGSNIMWYYKTGAPFELGTSQWDVSVNPPFNPNFTSQLTPDSVDLCSQFQPLMANNTLLKMTYSQLLSLSASALDSLLIAEFAHLDSLLLASPSASHYTLPTDISSYGKVKISYELMSRLPVTFSSASQVVNRIDSIRSFLSNTNIHKLFVLDTLADSRNTNQLIAELGNLIPQNQLKTNAVLFYTVYANFLNNNLTLSGSDSVVLLQIAHQHPANGGYMVYKARDLLGIYIFDSITLPVTPSASQMKQSLITEYPITQIPEIRIYPNPSREMIYIETTGIAGNNPAYVELFSATGIRVKSVHLNNNGITSISTDQLHSGVYYYRVIFNNNRVKTGKLVVQK